MNYASKLKARTVNKYTEPRPIQPTAFPHLEGPFEAGMTMEQQAGRQGLRVDERVAMAAASSSIIESPSTSAGPAPLPLTMQDMLPQEATKDPTFQAGSGSMLAVNQPELAAKYGVIRGRQHIPPQVLAGGTAPSAGGRRPIQQTLADLSKVMNASEAPLPKTTQEAEAQVSQSTAGMSQKAGAPLSSEEVQEVESAIQRMDDFDYDGLRTLINHDILNNPEQRELIESRLKPLDLGEMVMQGRVTQEIIIQPGVFWFELQSLTGDEELALKRLVQAESRGIAVTARYLLDKYAFMAMSLGVVSIVGRPVPYTHLDADGNFSDDKFWEKFRWVMKRPLHMLGCFGVNHTWFEMRCRKLFVVDNIKNG